MKLDTIIKVIVYFQSYLSPCLTFLKIHFYISNLPFNPTLVLV